LLTTTRAVRRRLDFSRPVPREVILECIGLSQQAPTGSNEQGWRWLVVTDAERRRALGAIYARAIPAIQARAAALDAGDVATRRVYSSAEWFASHLGEAPALVFPCIVGRPPERFSTISCATIYGSILPSVWSFQLALRSRGLGSTFTTVHLLFEQEVQTLLEIPAEVLQVGLLPVAYTRGNEFKPARRPPPESIVHWNVWK
jgi:nitroreductase